MLETIIFIVELRNSSLEKNVLNSLKLYPRVLLFNTYFWYEGHTVFKVDIWELFMIQFVLYKYKKQDDPLYIEKIVKLLTNGPNRKYNSEMSFSVAHIVSVYVQILMKDYFFLYRWSIFFFFSVTEHCYPDTHTLTYP